MFFNKRQLNKGRLILLPQVLPYWQLLKNLD